MNRNKMQTHAGTALWGPGTLKTLKRLFLHLLRFDHSEVLIHKCCHQHNNVWSGHPSAPSSSSSPSSWSWSPSWSWPHHHLHHHHQDTLECCLQTVLPHRDQLARRVFMFRCRPRWRIFWIFWFLLQMMTNQPITKGRESGIQRARHRKTYSGSVLIMMIMIIKIWRWLWWC